MEKELKEYLDRISGEISEIRETMATKKELAGVKGDIARVEKSLSKKIDTVEKKLTKKIDTVEKKLDDNIDYAKLLDQEFSEHRRNTEMHHAGLRKA